jgi:N-acetylglucosaminyldiphosphoundecaprenol N-acetyl-beta-D-mannosaminyltransferase
VIDAGKRNVLGVMIDVVDYDAAASQVLAAARSRRPFALTALAVHGVMTGVQDRAHAARLNAFDLATPDGQPVKWGLNLLHRAGLTDRVYGPTLTWQILKRCAADDLSVYVYGSTESTLGRLVEALTEKLPTLKIAGREPSKFRLSKPGEPEEIAERIRDSGAQLVLVGLGCPRQEQFAYGMRQLLDVPLLAVGAAFDYHAGTLRLPPRWMQRYGLEWLWRLALEPRRLWRRYVLLNPAYLIRLAAQLTHLQRPIPASPAGESLDQFPV